MIAQVVKKEIIARNTLFIEIALPREVDYQAGQSFRLTLINPKYSDRAGDNRFFSIANAPSQKNMISTAMRLRDSAFKKSMNELPLGSDIDVTSIAGVFLLPEDNSKDIVMIAGGIGIVPFISMLRHIREQNLNYRITLLYSNSSLDSLAFLDELKGYESDKFKMILTITRDLSYPGERRRINADFIKKYIANPSAGNYLIAGPPIMTSDLYDDLLKLGVGARNILTEEFTGY